MKNQWKEDYYEILEIPREASVEEIKAAYRKLISQYHPDKMANQPKKIRKEAQRITSSLNEAYRVLTYPSLKTDYDAWYDEQQMMKAQEKAVAQERTKRAQQQNSTTTTTSLMKVPNSQIANYDEKFAKAQLNRTPKGGTAKERIMPKIIGCIVVGVAIVGITVAVYFSSNKTNTPATEDQPGKPGLEESVNTVHENWSALTDVYDKSTVEEVVKYFRQEEANISQEEAAEVLVDIVNSAINTRINDAINGTDTEYEDINLSGIIADGTVGKDALVDMEGYLNGMLTDKVNAPNYARRACEDQAKLIAENETVGGLNVTDEASSVDPAVRFLWSRLARGANAVAGIIDDSIEVQVNGNTYSLLEIDDAEMMQSIEDQALKDLGAKAKSMNLE